MEDISIIISIILLLLSQMFYVNRVIGKLQAKINFCIKEIRKLNKKIEELINMQHLTLNDNNDV